MRAGSRVPAALRRGGGAAPGNSGASVNEPAGPDWDRSLEAVARRDAGAFAALFAHFAPRIKSVMIRSGLPPETAEEIAQEAFVAIWRHAAAFDRKKASASAWIFAIARNKKIDRLRKEARPEPDPADPAFAPDAPAEADSALDGRQRADRLRAAIAALPEAQRDVLVRAYFADRTHIEIAGDLCMPVGTVKSRLRLALARIRATLAADGLDDMP